MCSMPDQSTPEIETQMREAAIYCDGPAVPWMTARDIARNTVRSALDRQAREIVEAVRSYRGPSFTSADDVAHFIESRFAPKEADPR